jgi:hypothetical protein
MPSVTGSLRITKMCAQNIKDIVVRFDGEDLSKYGLFPLFSWYITDVIHLPYYFAQVSVNRKRNHKQARKNKKPEYTDVQMCMGLVAIAICGIPRLYQIDDALKTEPQVAHLIGLPQFFDQSTAHSKLYRFSFWHVSQLDRINTQLLSAHGESTRQDVIILDIDSQTHTLESRKREKAVVGYNRKKPGKPCVQWNVGFVRGEAVSQRLMAGNTHGSQSLQWIIEDVQKKLSKPISILRLDSGYMSGDTLNYVVEHRLHLCMAARYNWILACGVSLDEAKWQRLDEKTRLYELGQCQAVSTSKHQFRTILVEKEQEPFPGSKSKKKILRYGIVEQLPFSLSCGELYQFYHGRQTIEQFFKESTGPFNAGKLPSHFFRGNEAYLHLVTIAENCCVLFKKKFSLPIGKAVLWKPLETS